MRPFRGAMTALFAVLVALTPVDAYADIFACEPPEAIFVHYQRTPCEDGEHIATLLPEGATPPYDTVLQRADTYYRRHALGGETFEAEAWYTEETLSSGVYFFLADLPTYTEGGRAHADERGGIETIEFEVTGEIEGLIAVRVFVVFENGEIDKQDACWKHENTDWKMHLSCLEIALQGDDLSEEDEETLRALDAAIRGQG